KIKVRAPFDAKAAWGHAGRLYKYAVHCEMVEVSPVASLDKKLVFRNVVTGPRQRVLSDDEVAAFWSASGEIAYPYGPLYRLLLLTSVRINELARASWTEFHPELRRLMRTGQPVDWRQVDDGVKTWTVSAARFKSGVDHLVPLSNDALSILESLPRFANCDFVFSTAGKKPINSFSQAKAKLDALMLDALRAAAKRRGDDPDATKLPAF